MSTVWRRRPWGDARAVPNVSWVHRLRTLAALVAVALAWSAVPAAADAEASVAHRADGQIADWVGEPTMLAGRSTVDRGELIYDDYLYDDYGPNLDRLPNPTPFQSYLSATNGDFRYPTGENYGLNAADLRQLRIAADDDALHVALHLQTLKTLDTTIATVAIDTDGEAATGGTTWPDGSRLTTPGADRFVTVWGTGARLTDSRGNQTDLAHGADLVENVYEATVPLASLGAVSPQAKVWVVTGIADSDRFAAQDSGAAVFDIGFQGAEKYGKVESPGAEDPSLRYIDVWNDRRQAAALATGDITGFSHPLNLPALQARSSIPFRLTPGWYNRNFRSAYEFGEGTTPSSGLPSTAEQHEPMFKSRYQTYGLYVPSGYDPANPTRALLDLHSFMCNMNQYPALSPNRLQHLGDDHDTLIFTPLGRSTDTASIGDAGVVDVLEAWDDVKAHYNVDADGTSVAGMAQGGYLTYRLGLLMPDRFARAAVHLGPAKDPTYFAPGVPPSRPGLEVTGDNTLLVENSFNLPYELNYSSAAPLVPITGGRLVESLFRDNGSAYRFYDNPTLIEPFSVFYHDNWVHSGDWLAGGKREANPVRVRYVRYPVNDLDPKYGLRFDSAYWVADLEVRGTSAGEKAHGSIDATTYARGGAIPAVAAEAPTLDTTDTAPAIVNGQRRIDGAPIVKRNGFKATLTNLASVRFKTTRMGLDPQSPMTATLVGDGATTLRFDGSWPPGVHAALDGVDVPVTSDGRGIRMTVNLPAGAAHTLVVWR